MPKPYQVKDHYFLEAKKHGYRARSAFKLLELQERLEILDRGDHVLDLGASPGSWLQVASKIIGREGYLLGVDLDAIETLPAVHTMQADIFSEETARKISEQHPDKFDIILSDLAPKTSGIKDVDQYKSVELNLRVLELCKTFLKPRGTAVFKVFIGADFHTFQAPVKAAFEMVKQLKLKASRERSYEAYVVGMGFKNE